MSVSDDQPHTRTRLPATEQPPGPQAPGFRRLRVLGGVFVVVFLLVVAVAVINRTNGTPAAPAAKSNDSGSTAVSPTAPSGVPPVTTTTNDIGVQYPHTSEGAQSAAANYSVALGSSEMYATASRHAIVATVVDPSVVGTMQQELDSSYSAQAAQLGLGDGKAPRGLTFVSRAVPIGTKSVGYADDNATVEVWNTSLTGLAGQGSTRPVTEFWYTLTLKLRWVGNDWKVSGLSQTDGPTPIGGTQTASSYADMANAVTQFGGFRYAR